ncbi:sensor histidine kinase [Agromyces aurantiacus]|uniref:histidine kinase n=1 Tax=Agromyces aurantiacus TaxID=165814 RepID=A0ABV9R2D5_9MICO|nr:ATP-binding protein [Agromyces aurantiacus]MBM7505932.1 signal transduction histidine kinase [Agromyces aurantiacus]
MALSAARVGVARAALAVTGVLLALATAWIAWDARNVPVLVLDLVVGLAYVGLAAAAVPVSRPAVLLAGAVAVSWFAGTAWTAAVFWHRGAITWLLLAFPLLLPGTRLEGIVAAGALAVSVMPFVWADPVASVAIASVLAAAGAWSAAGARRRSRAVRAPRLALVGFAAVILVGGLLEIGGVSGAELPYFVAYEVTVGAIALTLGTALPRRTASSVADLVIDLDGAGTASMRQRLSRALAEHGVRIAYWDDATRTYRADDGRPAGPSPSPDRAMTPLTRGGRPVALLERDPGAGTSAELVDAVGAASAAVDEHDRLTTEIRARVTEVEDTRRRLARAADLERRDLRDRLTRTVEQPLEELISTVREAASTPEGAALSRTEAILERALAELADAAQGIRPAELALGLGPALEVLAARSPLEVDLSPGSGTRSPPEVEAAMYAAVSEALQNAAKHAGAERVRIDIDDADADADGPLTIRIVDTGSGGADLARGHGLRSLVDRVRSVGGDVRIDSPPGGGTVVELAYRRGRA